MSAPTLAQNERATLADLFDTVGPTAPTLCEGWLTQDLCEHLVVRESDPLALPGIFVPALSGITRRRMARAAHRGSWTDLVDRFRRGPGRLSPLALSPVDAAVNGMEFFVHHEDVRRAGNDPLPPRLLRVADEQTLWTRVSLLSRIAFSRAPVGVVVENALDPEASVRVRTGDSIVTMAGKPSEIVLWLSGRRSVTDVEFIGEDDAIAQLQDHVS